MDEGVTEVNMYKPAEDCEATKRARPQGEEPSKLLYSSVKASAQVRAKFKEPMKKPFSQTAKDT